MRDAHKHWQSPALAAKRAVCAAVAIIATVLSADAGTEAPRTDAAEVSEEWRAYAERLLPIADRLVAQFPENLNYGTRQALFQLIFSQISAAYIGLLHADVLP